MRIGSIFSIAASGLRSAAQRLKVSAHNVSNMNTDGFKAQRTIDVADQGGGVSTHVSRVDEPGPVIIRDGQFVEGSNTNLVVETVNQIQAVQAYRANLNVAEAAAEMLEETTREH